MTTFSDSTEIKESCVRVAVRIRPQNSREKIDLCRICTTVTNDEPQIILGLDKAFTYDHVFDINSTQEEVYSTCVEKLVVGTLKGYNATVLAYGQTGSGKTFTMGTGFEHDLNDNYIGIIPRAVNHIFDGINTLEHTEDCDVSSRGKVQFSVAIQFIELYNEEIVDLLEPYSKDRAFKIVENNNHEISITGATIRPIKCTKDALTCLQQGALARTTASTKMNDQSSRSHALFTILIKRQRIFSNENFETITSKFNFVDLAGSERLKRTGATGERAREGISINCGLLALGNCISALGDVSKKATHIPYRDSKLTRLLQDSLGGNSQTLMIACISPSDRDFMETLSTLKYANRARNIRNKIQINQDQSSRTICQLRREIAALQLEILEFKQGKRNADTVGNSTLSDTFYENAMLMADNKRLQNRLKCMQGTINMLTEKNIQLSLEKEMQGWNTINDPDQSVSTIIAGYLSEIETLQTKLIESELLYQQLSNVCSECCNSRKLPVKNDSDNPEDVIRMAKLEIVRDRESLSSKIALENFNGIIQDSLSESEESLADSEEKTEQMQSDLNLINSDIEVKTKLIEQLELSQQRIEIMRQHYEEKLQLLNTKILNTEKERDEVLSNYVKPNSTDNLRKIKEDYERKLNEMQRELRRLQQAQKEHARQQREMQAKEVRLRKLRSELEELKCSKTRLIRKMADQSLRHKEVETRRIREIAQLRKEQRRSLNAVKSLQAKMLAKEQILKRKTEEVTALRKNQRGNLSRKAAGRLVTNTTKPFNRKIARQRFEHIFRSISWAARNKQLLFQFEKELDKLMIEREKLCHDLVNVQNGQSSKSMDMVSEEDSIRSNLSYLQENIAIVQQSIMECEEGKDNNLNNSVQHASQEILNNIESLEEAKYVLENLIDSYITLSCNLSLTENRIQEQEELLEEALQETSIQQQVLQHFLSQSNSVKFCDIFNSTNSTQNKRINNDLNMSDHSLISDNSYDVPCAEINFIHAVDIMKPDFRRLNSRGPTVDLLFDNSGKIRRRAALPQELLFGNKGDKSRVMEDL